MYDDVVKRICLSMYGKLKSLRHVSGLTNEVSKSTIHNWVTNVPNHPKACRKTTEDNVDFVRSLLQNNAYLCARDIITEIKTRFRMEISETSVRTCIKKAGFTYKKCRYVVTKENLDAKRAEFAARVSATINPNDVLSVDESSVAFETMAQYGYAPKGRRLNAPVATMRSKRWSLLLATGNDGFMSSIMVEGAIKSDIYASFVRSLAGCGKRYLLMDNASIHKTNLVAAACESADITCICTWISWTHLLRMVFPIKHPSISWHSQFAGYR